MEQNNMNQLALQLENQVFQYLDLTCEISDEQIYARIDEQIMQLSDTQYLTMTEKVKLRQQIFNSMRGLDVLTPILEDETVTEIMINGYENIFVERAGVIQKCPVQFGSSQKYYDVIQQIVSNCNRVVNESSPIVDARLTDGSRVNVVLSPISLDGATMTIRKFPKQALTMERLLELRSLEPAIAKLLKLFVRSGYNIIISGGTGSGKTTFLNALSNYIPKDERIITIEDSAELRIEGIANLVRLEVRNANVEGENAVTMKQLIKASLRMRPDRIIVGEVRGEEAMDMLQALNTGHDGSISTGHANSAQDMLSRLEVMALMAVDMPVYALRGQIASAVEIIIHLGRLRDHTRRVLEIVEVLGMQEGEIMCQTLFSFEETEENHALVQGQLVFKHQMKQVRKLKEAGYYDKYLDLMRQFTTVTWMEEAME